MADDPHRDGCMHDPAWACEDCLAARRSRLPSGEWRCRLSTTTEPCGECGGCREVQAENRDLAAALADRDLTLPALADDPVAQRLGLAARARAETLREAVEALERAWNDTCCGNRNEAACESCRAYADAITAVRSLA